MSDMFILHRDLRVQFGQLCVEVLPVSRCCLRGRVSVNKVAQTDHAIHSGRQRVDQFQHGASFLKTLYEMRLYVWNIMAFWRGRAREGDGSCE